MTSVRVTTSYPVRRRTCEEPESFGIEAIRVLAACNEVIHEADKWDIDEGRLYITARGGSIVATYNQGAWESVTLRE